MLNTEFSPWPSFTEEDAEAISRVLLSNKVNYWTGEETRQFEREFAHFADSDHAVAIANGTLALDLALKALDIGPGDEVVVTPRTFIASISSVITAGAKPVFADVDRTSQCISAETIEAVLTSRTKAVVVVHLAGQPADMDPIMELATGKNILVIEDCAQAHGARYKGRSVGSIGHIGAWSFCQDKIMSTGGEGGMVTTSDVELWRRMWEYKDHGKSWDAVYEREHPPGYRWLHDSFGTNWRMTEIQAVLGRRQLVQMPHWQVARASNHEKIRAACADVPWLRIPPIDPDVVHAAYKAYVFVEPSMLPNAWTRDGIMELVVEQGVPCYSGSCSEVYRERAFDNAGLRPVKSLPIARELGETSLMFLVHPTLTNQEIEKTCSAIRKVVEIVESGRNNSR